MNSALFDAVAKALSSPIPPGGYILHTKGKTHLNTDRFIPLTPSPAPTTLCFIDGGNAEIFRTPSHTCHLGKAAAVTLQGRQRKQTRIEPFCLLCQTLHDCIEITWFGTQLKTGPIPLNDPELAQGSTEVSAQACVTVCRTLAELALAQDQARQLSPHSMLILDGDLFAPHRFITQALHALFAACTKQQVSLIAIAKTTTARTDTGMSAPAALSTMAPPGAWTYPLNCTDGIHRAFAKLHPNSRHIFLISSPSPLSPHTLSCLLDASSDCAFPGYPYGLVAADQLARVGTREQETATMLLSTKALDNDPVISTALSGSDAHQILDRMQY